MAPTSALPLARRFGRGGPRSRSNVSAHGRVSPARSSKFHALLCLLAVASWFGLFSTCLAASGQVSGTVTDALGRPVAEVSVALRDGSDRRVVQAVTDKRGQFTLTAPKPGPYVLVAAKPGHKGQA